MHMVLHHLKVAVRNLLKYKLQTVISVLSIAIGIVTLAFVHAALSKMTFPSIYSQPYADRTYSVGLEPVGGYVAKVDSTGRRVPPPSFSRDILRALKCDGGLKSVERMAVPNGTAYSSILEFRLGDSVVRKMSMSFTLTDPGYFNLLGIRSAVTGHTIGRLKPGEAIISRKLASIMFGDVDPRGAVHTKTTALLPVPLTIVDVFEDVSEFDRPLYNTYLYVCLGEMEGESCGAVDGVGGDLFYAPWLTTVLRREGCTESQLLQELNARLEPFGLTATLESAVNQADIRLIVSVQMLVHLIGALILIAAVIGFLRMEVQLFWMRRREVSLRITHGAKRWQLFRLLFAEVLMVTGMAVAVAMSMGSWVERFFHSHFERLISDTSVSLQNLAYYSFCIGVVLLLLCGIVIWVALGRISKAGQGLAVHMRGSHTHLFRNVMLGLQMAISIIFVCGSLTVGRWSGLLMKHHNLPDDLEPYKESLFLRLNEVNVHSLPLLKKEIAELPGLEKMMVHEMGWYQITDIQNNREVLEALGGQSYFQHLVVPDTSVVDFYRLRVNWLHRPTGSGAYLLLNDSLYRKFRRMGVATSDALRVSTWGFPEQLYPIAGTIPGIPYEVQETSIMVHPDAELIATDFVLVPKTGKYRQLLSQTESAIRRVEPSVVQKMATNFHENHDLVPLIENFCIVGWILAGISILICVMSIYSTIALDTRSRRKEVAIRKVCGAKSRDIYRLFGRVYLLLVLLSLFIALPVAVLFHRFLFSESVTGFQVGAVSPLISCIGGSLIVIALIAAIVLWNIRSTMRTNPSEIIAKE